MIDSKWHITTPVFEADSVCPDYKVWPWNGHRLFAYDLITFLQPKLYVELGTYWGTSFFSFCQAVKDHDLQTRCVAIDTWEGDDHTGKYEKDVYETVSQITTSIFSDLDISLIQSYFHDAVESFADSSIDLLHIDGFHTYDAVKNDFEAWLPKLAANGVVLFHDIADSCDYGSVRYWNELLAQYPGFSFQHSWGLGVLFPKGDLYYKQMIENNIVDKNTIYEYSSELNLLKIQKEASDVRGENQDRLIKHQAQQIIELQQRLEPLEEEIERTNSSLALRVMRKLRLIK